MSKRQDTGKCRCGSCRQEFGSLSAFDAHRQGPYTARRRLGSAEMVERGFALDAKSRWRFGKPRPVDAPRRDRLGGTLDMAAIKALRGSK